MKYHHGLSDTPVTSLPSVFLLGGFDGLHCGHQYLLRKSRGLANDLGAPLVVMAFSIEGASHLITSHHKRRLFERFPVDILIEVPLTPSLKNMSAEAFVEALQRMVPIHTWVGGVDLRFGKGREGSCDFLSKRTGMKTLFLERLCLGGEEVSSTKVRQLVAAGEIARAGLFLGRPYSLMALATPFGQGRYRLDLSDLCLPPAGEYGVTVSAEGFLSDRFGTLRVGTTSFVLLDDPILCPTIFEVTL